MKIDTIVEDLKNGKPVIVVDDYDRENEGDIVIAAEKADVDNIVFAMRYARGLMCIPTAGEILDRLEIPMMVETTTDELETPFTVSVDAVGTSTGMSVHDRLLTISKVLGDDTKPEDLQRPGHLFPLRPRSGLLKDRRGHTEASTTLMHLCKFKPVSIIVEIVNDNGTMATGDDLQKFKKLHNLSMISVEEIYEAYYGESSN